MEWLTLKAIPPNASIRKVKILNPFRVIGLSLGGLGNFDWSERGYISGSETASSAVDGGSGGDVTIGVAVDLVHLGRLLQPVAVVILDYAETVDPDEV